jgi:hypothetical protein
VFAFGKRSYLIQYRASGRTRRYTIGQHGRWTPETAWQEAKVQLGGVARGDTPPRNASTITRPSRSRSFAPSIPLT